MAKTAIDSGYDSTVVDAVDMAREALEQEPCDDCISREQALKEFEKDQYHREYCIEHEIDRSISMEMVRIRLHDLLSVQPKPKAGHWNRVIDKAGHLVWECDCGWQQRFATNFCPDCVTKMIEPQESEDKE